MRCWLTHTATSNGAETAGEPATYRPSFARQAVGGNGISLLQKYFRISHVGISTRMIRARLAVVVFPGGATRLLVGDIFLYQMPFCIRHVCVPGVVSVTAGSTGLSITPVFVLSLSLSLCGHSLFYSPWGARLVSLDRNWVLFLTPLRCVIVYHW